MPGNGKIIDFGERRRKRKGERERERKGKGKCEYDCRQTGSFDKSYHLLPLRVDVRRVRALFSLETIQFVRGHVGVNGPSIISTFYMRAKNGSLSLFFFCRDVSDICGLVRVTGAFAAVSCTL